MISILKIIWFTLLWAIMWLIGLPVVAIGLLFKKPITEGLDNDIAQYPNYRLPKILWPWDNRMDGVAGDIYWRQKGKWNTYWRMYVWTAFRNATFNWRTKFGGIDGTVEKILINGEDQDGIPLQDRPRVDNYISMQGSQFNELWLADGTYHIQYKYMKAYPFKIKGKQLGFFLDIGADISATRVGKLEHLTFTFRPNPFKGFEEK